MTPEQLASIWANDPFFDVNTQAYAAKCLQNASLCAEAFGEELRFGTGGLRGILGVGTARMNPYTVSRATLGLAAYLKQHFEDPKAVISYDSRHHSAEFAELAGCVLTAENIKVFVFPSLAPTPMLSFAVRLFGASAGIMITASHNPANYNGYKVYGPDGCQITDRAAASITDSISRCSYTDAVRMPKDKAVLLGLWKDLDSSVWNAFAKACLSCRQVPEAKEPLHIVYTPLFGTGLIPVRSVLSQMNGVRVTEVSEQCEPDGDFPGCPKPNPELDEALTLGLQTARTVSADLLLATDPDCDRVGVCVQEPDGAFVRLSGNEVGLLLMDHILRTKKGKGSASEPPIVLKTIVTSDLAFPIAKAYGAEVHEVLTGFKYIGEWIGLLEKENAIERFAFGFEESCGYLAGTHVRDKDGVMACMLICEMAQVLKAQGLTLWERLQEIYHEYGYLGTRLVSYDIHGSVPMEKMSAVMKHLREHSPDCLLDSTQFAVKDYLPGIDGLPKSNVLVFSSDFFKAIVRPSGTEPKIKVYLSAKGKNADTVKPVLDQLEQEMNQLLQC